MKAFKGSKTVLENGYVFDSVTMFGIARTMKPQEFDSL